MQQDLPGGEGRGLEADPATATVLTARPARQPCSSSHHRAPDSDSSLSTGSGSSYFASRKTDVRAVSVRARFAIASSSASPQAQNDSIS